MSEPEIICETRGAAGVVTLNRPKALNALTLAMVRDLARALDAWEADPAVTRIVVTGAGGRAFCAGGDIRQLYEAGRAGRHAEALTFWREEYLLNIRIKRYAKPYLSLIDGIVMGGGVGLSLHGSHIVAGERYLFAMPEVGIGFFPDVGATYALPRLPGATGAYLAMTGARIGPDDAAALGLATHRVGSDGIAALPDRLAAGDPVDEVLASLATPAGAGPAQRERPTIDACFAAESVASVLDRLDAAAHDGSAFAGETAATIRTKSPTSVALAFAQMRRGRDLGFEDAMAIEFRIVSRILDGHDFYEGVRATIIDKDGKPDWRPPTLGEVGEASIEAYFADLGPAELPVGR